MFQLRMPFLMVVIAASALLIWGWRFRNENLNAERALLSLRIHDLLEGNTRDRLYAAELLRDASTDEWALVLPALAAGTHDQEAKVRRASVQSLSENLWRSTMKKSGVNSEEIGSVTPIFLAALKDHHHDVRTEAVRALARLKGEIVSLSKNTRIPYGPDPRRVLPALAEATRDQFPDVRDEAIRAFDWFAPETEDAPLGMIEAMINDPDTRARENARRSLDRPWTRENAVSAVPALLQALDSKKLMEDKRIPQIIAKFGKAARPALPKLLPLALKQVDKTNYSNHFTFIDTIIAIDPDSDEGRALVDLFIQKLRDPNSSHERGKAIDALAKFGPSAAPAVPALIDLLRNSSYGIPARASAVLAKIGPRANAALASLRRLTLQDLAWQPGYLIHLDTIIAIDPGSREALSLLMPLVMMEKSSRASRTSAWLAIEQILKRCPDASKILEDALHGPDAKIRAAVTRFLDHTDDPTEPVRSERP